MNIYYTEDPSNNNGYCEYPKTEAKVGNGIFSHEAVDTGTACAEIGTDIFRLEAEETLNQLRKFHMKQTFEKWWYVISS